MVTPWLSPKSTKEARGPNKPMALLTTVKLIKLQA